MFIKWYVQSRMDVNLINLSTAPPSWINRPLPQAPEFYIYSLTVLSSATSCGPTLLILRLAISGKESIRALTESGALTQHLHNHSFLTLRLMDHPLYPRIVSTLSTPSSSPPLLLDLGCCVAQEYASTHTLTTDISTQLTNSTGSDHWRIMLRYLQPSFTAPITTLHFSNHHTRSSMTKTRTTH
jgi:hypothetical protein